MYKFDIISAIKEKNRIYLGVLKENVILEMDILTGKLNCLCCIPEKRIDERSFDSTVYFDNKLIFSPYNSNKLWIFNINTKKWSSVLCDGVDRYFTDYKMIFESKLFLIRRNEPMIEVLDIVNENIKKVIPIKVKDEKVKAKFSHRTVARKGNDLIITCQGYNKLFCFHMDKMEYEWISVGKHSSYEMVFQENNKIWLIASNYNQIICWNENGSIKDYKLPIMSGVEKYTNICYDGMKLYVNTSGNKTLTIDKNDNCLFEKKKYENCWIKEGTILLNSVEHIIQVIEDNNNYECYPSISVCELRKQIEDKYNSNNISIKKIIVESQLYNLKDFIKETC